MRIAVTTSGDDLQAPVDPRFGRAKAFIIYDTNTGDWSLVDNTQNLNAAQGAGVQSGTTVVNAGAEAVITGNCGPRAFTTLAAGGVQVYTGAAGTVRDAIEAFQAGSLEQAQGANVGAHFGAGA